MKLILLGAPGAGKGTQAERLCAAKRLAHISTGDMLRAKISAGTELGQKAKQYMDKGELVPDDVIIGMVEERVKEPDCESGFVLDGFPRTIAQADALAKIVQIDKVINIEVSAPRLVERISGRRVCKSCGAVYHVSFYDKDVCEKCGGSIYQREDDQASTILNRLEVYKAKTQPLIDYYQAKGLLTRVDGDRDDRDETTRILLKATES